MVEFCLMASHGFPPGLGLVSHQEQVFAWACMHLHSFIPRHGSNQDLLNSHSLNFSLREKERKLASGLLRIDSTFNMPALIDFQDNHPNSMLLSFGISEQCARQDKFLKLLASGSIELEGELLDLSMIYDFMGSQPVLKDLSQQPFASYSAQFFNDSEPQNSLIYPTREFYLNESLTDLVGDCGSCSECTCLPDGQLSGMETKDILSVISKFNFSKNSVKSSKQTMLVPYFERRKRGRRANTDASKRATEQVGSQKIHGRPKDTLSQKKKTGKRTGQERDLYSNSHLHACESLLSVIVNGKKQDRNAILLLKKFGPQLSRILTQFSAAIAGTGMAVVFSIFCRVACSSAPLGASKLLSAGLGLGLVWLSWAVNELRNTVIVMGKNSDKLGAKEEEMMNNLDRNFKDVHFRVAALTVVAVLRLA